MESQQSPKYYAFIGMLLVTLNTTSNIMAGRIIPAEVFGLNIILPGGIIAFPATFFLLDIVTEFYGYKNAKRLIWFNLICQGTFALLITLILSFKTSITPEKDAAFQSSLGTSLLIFVAFFSASLVADTFNCKLMAKWKTYTNGKHLWVRAFGSTALGELLFSVVWVSIYFFGTLPSSQMMTIILSQYVIKLLYEAFCLPLTYLAVYLLKKHETYQPIRYENFNPQA
ncbi:queuosine precursor transporter [Chromobacterium sp. IIBBL 290-4]|uniref:queuosine precursor transporter n=1 Tax=Chromobacterium sp. IIBBL 290-4 TaxID=2953890 RepID=UPI0020B83150|nr:queuosine precursor transporter [Chromobacterium sp. IIBBL 290-4]UTH74159.1 queuosine precursor transporter [Chromobacterium sp. IIBBL 290-4]